ncbi:MAG: hypothetical protein JJE55_07455 [Flavobacteriaceae bacterium]|nr:hypothetical protein [Flavobacteriaceae bacterium]
MDKKIIKKEEKVKINLSEIPLNSSLGFLAYGDIAFKAWRKIKIENRERENGKK